MSEMWRLRIGGKLILSRLPIPYKIWKRLHMFEHGDMDIVESGIQTVLGHALASGFMRKEDTGYRLAASEANILEVGPGDSLLSAAVFNALGASNIYLIDAGDYASKSIEKFKEASNYLSSMGIQPIVQQQYSSFAEALRVFNARYMTAGTDSIRSIPPNTIDYCFSNAVLEHVLCHEMKDFLRELYKSMRPGGISFHRIDLRDHLGGALNNLRLSDKIWESDFFRKSGFYTNRIGFDEFIELFVSAGFKINVPRIARWEKLPTSPSKMLARFRSRDNLDVQGFDIIACK